MRLLNNKPLLITIVVAIILVLLLFVIPGGAKISGVESVPGGVAAGAQNFFSKVTGSVGSFFANLFGGNSIEKENAQLKEQLIQAQQKIEGMSELESENQRLQALLNYVERSPEYSYITARVTAKDPGYYFDVFVVNAGFNNGVQVNDAVITPDGLVGRVIEVGGSWSKVMAIIDSRSSVSATVERTRDNGIINGIDQSDVSSGLCEMAFLPLEAELLPGDSVITNGLGGLFPKGIVVGQVVEVSQEAGNTGKTVRIKPSVDFLHLEEVLIIKEKTAGTGDSQPTAQPSASPTGTTQPSPSVSPTQSPQGNE